MHYALDLRTFIYSHYFYLGLRVATGILGLTLATLAVSNQTTAMTVGVAAFCTSLMELPSPLRHKFNELMSATLLCSTLTLIVSLCAPYPHVMKPVLIGICFVVGMTMVYGKKSNPLQLSALLIMTLSMVHDMSTREAIIHSATFLGGGLAYTGYAMAVAWLLRHRIKQQVLAEALFELAHYVDIKSDFYDSRYNLTDQFKLLVRTQSVLAERQQASRDQLLRGPRNPKDAIPVQIHFGMLDLYEQILSTHTDYTLLRTHLADSDALIALRDLTRKSARDIEAIAYAVTRNKASYARLDYGPELRIIDGELQNLHQRRMEGEPTQEAQAVLRAQRNKLQAIIGMIRRLHVATQAIAADSMPYWDGADMALFLSQQKYNVGLMLSNLRFDSPFFRYALRLALAVTVGLLIGPHLPYAAHSYWIVLTIAVILRPSFSVTKRRLSDRLTGTLIGCALTFFVLNGFDETWIIVAVLYVAMVAAPMFLYLRYRYAAMAFSVAVLLQMHLMQPTAHIIRERLVDTIVGGVLATLFSFLLTNWEYLSLPRLVRAVLQANRTYMDASFRLLQGKCRNDFVYRIERKRLMDALSALSGALERMLDEPAAKQRSAVNINQFIVQNYLLVAHVAALRSLLQRHMTAMPMDAVHAVLEHTQAQIGGTLVASLRQLDPDGTDGNGAAPQATLTAPAPLSPEAAAWTGWPLVQRRIRLLLADADRITHQSAAIVRDAEPVVNA